MDRISNTESGSRAEEFLIAHVRCPACGSRLQQYGANRPLRDVLCVQCDFQAQVKSVKVSPRNRIRGAGIRLRGLRDSGGLVPPHFFVWGWDAADRSAEAIDFAPFIPWSSVSFRELPQTMARKADRGRIRAEYTGVLDLPRVRVYDGKS